MSKRLSDQTMRQLIDREVKEMLRRIDEDARNRYHLDASSSSAEVLEVDTASESDGNDRSITLPDRLSKPYGDNFKRTSTPSHKRRQSVSQKGCQTCQQQLRWLVQGQHQIVRQLCEVKQLLASSPDEVNLEAFTSPAEPIFNHMVTMEDFDRFTVALGDNSYRQEVISYLASFGGEETPTFVERVFSALFADEITFHLKFIGRQKNSRSLFGSAVYEVIFDVFRAWNTDHRSDRQQLEDAFKAVFRRARDRARKRTHRPRGWPRGRSRRRSLGAAASKSGG